MNVALRITISSSMNAMQLLMLEGYSWNESQNPFKLSNGKWQATINGFPLDSDNILDVGIVLRGERNRECKIVVEMKRSNKKVKKEISGKFGRRGWLLIKDSLEWG